MSCHKKANMKVPSYEPSWPNSVEKISAADSKTLQLKGSPVKEPVIFKTPLPAVDVPTTTLFSQNHNSRTVHNKENSTGKEKDHDRTLDSALDDSGYLSLQTSHNEDYEDHVHEAKYVTPKTSPTKCQEAFTPIEIHREKGDSFSMSSTPAEPCLPILRFQQSVCEQLAKGFQKTKRYDWSIIPKLAEDYNLDRVIGGHMGVDFVDVFSSLLSRNMKCLLGQILALLGDLDLISCKKVSKTWRQIILEDSAARKRCQQAETALRESQPQRKCSGLTRDVAVSRVVLSSLQSVASSPALHRDRSKAASPEGTRFSQYLEAASVLKQHESLRHCRRCGAPALHQEAAQRATCTRDSCSFDCCTGCHQAFHGSTPCRALQPRSGSRSTAILPGSARSRRNVRRL